jgi:uncharacterized LabA/DUF88 family protein
MKIAVFIDGNNLANKLKEMNIKNFNQFDYWQFILSLTGNVKPKYIGYYVGQIRKEVNNPKSVQLFAKQQKLFTYLQTNVPHLQIIRGHIQKFNQRYQEKGVDVRLALDVFKHITDFNFHKAIILSSDTDLLPVVKMVQNMKNKVVEYVGFSHQPARALWKECKVGKLLKRKEVQGFGGAPQSAAAN